MLLQIVVKYWIPDHVDLLKRCNITDRNHCRVRKACQWAFIKSTYDIIQTESSAQLQYFLYCFKGIMEHFYTQNLHAIIKYLDNNVPFLYILSTYCYTSVHALSYTFLCFECIIYKQCWVTVHLGVAMHV